MSAACIFLIYASDSFNDSRFNKLQELKMVDWRPIGILNRYLIDILLNKFCYYCLEVVRGLSGFITVRQNSNNQQMIAIWRCHWLFTGFDWDLADKINLLLISPHILIINGIPKGHEDMFDDFKWLDLTVFSKYSKIQGSLIIS